MHLLDFESLLSSYVLLVGAVALATVAYRYYRERDLVFWDAGTYFVLLMCLYVAVPAFVHVETGVTALGASYETIRFSAQYSLYFMFVVAVYYLIKALRSPAERHQSRCGVQGHITLAPISNNVIYGIYAVIVTYVLAAFFLSSPGIYSLWSDRLLASALSMALNETYKIQLMFAITVSLIVYLTMKNGGKRYLLMLLPFVALNLMTTGRDLLFQSLMVAIAVYLLTGTRIPVLKLAAISVLIVSIEMLRATWAGPFELGSYVFVPGELLNSAETGHLLIESQRSVSLLDLVLYSLGKIFTPQLMMALFGGVVSFRDIVTAESQAAFGLGGSLLSEVFSTKNYYLYVLYPFIAIAYLESVNLLRARAGYFGILVFVFYLISTHWIFRGGVIFVSMDPLYYALYAAGWYWILRMAFADRVRRDWTPPVASACPIN